MPGPAPGRTGARREAAQDPWVVRFDGYEPREEGRREALCTVGNGYLATRGAAAESVADGVHYPGTYLAGVYNRLDDEVTGRTVRNESLVNLPNWLALRLRVAGGAWLCLDHADLIGHHQELDVRRGILCRSSRWRDDVGRTTTVTERRLVSMDSAHVCALECTVVPEDWSGRLDVRSLLDGSVENSLVERYRGLSTQHLELVRTAMLGEDAVLLEMVTSQSAIRVAMAARTSVPSGAKNVVRRFVDDGPVVGQDLALDVREGEPLVLEKVVTVYTSRDRAISEPADAAVRWLSRAGTFADLASSHERAWRRLWARADVRLEGAAEIQGILRLHLLHLLQTVSPSSAHLDVGVPARGLHGEAYRGHVFWDELFVLPLLNLRVPSVSLSLLLYRHRRLPEAREAARAAGRVGAMYPWQSGSDGREESQRLHLNPLSGHWVPDSSSRQHHVGLAIAYNVWQYYQATGDRAFLIGPGAEMLVEIARFWNGMATFDPDKERYDIRGVMGPDEFHTGYPGREADGVDNNAYTNVMTSWVLSRTLEALHLLPDRRRGELVESTGVDAAEIERWDDVSHRLFVPVHHGVISQFQGYEDLIELDWPAYRERYGDVRRLDRILEAEGDSVARYKVSKQADAVMLFYLFSGDGLRGAFRRLGHRLDADLVPRTVRYYLERSSHGSTLSALVHSWVLARLERRRSIELLGETLLSDLADVQGGTTREGVHLAAMAGGVDLMQRCFTGLAARHDRLVLDPCWPTSLGAIEFSVCYRSEPLTVRVHSDGVATHVEVRAGPGMRRPVHVECRGATRELMPGSTVRFRAPDRGHEPSSGASPGRAER